MKTGMKILFMSLPLLFSGVGYSQTTSGSIAGNVVDAQHAALPNAAVTAKELQQQFTVSTKTDESGRFVLPQIPPGRTQFLSRPPGSSGWNVPVSC
jgi:hypothetical protein